MRRNSHLSVCPVQKFTGLLERVVSISSPELCKERLDKFVAGMARYGKEGGKRRHLTASEPRSCVITNQNSVTSEDFRLLLWGVKDTQQLYGCSELERPAPSETPHCCGGGSTDREEEPAPGKEPCRGKRDVHMPPACCCPGIPSSNEATSATLWGSRYACLLEW